MKTPLRALLIAAFIASSSTGSFGAVITFDDFLIPEEPFGDFISIADANQIAGGVHTQVYHGITWDFTLMVVRDDFRTLSQHASDQFESDGLGPFAKPHSGRFALFNSGGLSGPDYCSFYTTQVLTGVWLGRPCLGECPGGATQVTVTAWGGSNALASVSLNLTSTTPAFLDTSSFLLLTGITRYSFDRLAGTGGEHDRGYFIADDFAFTENSLADLCPPSASPRYRLRHFLCVRRSLVEMVREGALTRRQAHKVFLAAIREDRASRLASRNH